MCVRVLLPCARCLHVAFFLHACYAFDLPNPFLFLACRVKPVQGDRESRTQGERSRAVAARVLEVAAGAAGCRHRLDSERAAAALPRARTPRGDERDCSLAQEFGVICMLDCQPSITHLRPSIDWSNSFVTYTNKKARELAHTHDVHDERNA